MIGPSIGNQYTQPLVRTSDRRRRHRPSYFSSSAILSFLTRIFEANFFSQMNEQRTPRANVIGRFRCDARLIRESVEIDFRVEGRLVEKTSKNLKLFAAFATLCDHRKRFLSSCTKMSPRRKTVSHGKCSHLRREISRYPRVVFLRYLRISKENQNVSRARVYVCVFRNKSTMTHRLLSTRDVY